MRAAMVVVSAVVLGAGPAAAQTTTVSVPGVSSLYNDWAYPFGGNQYDATPAGITVCSNQTVTIAATGCVVDRNTQCTGPGGVPSQTFRELTTYSLIGAWSSSPTVMDGTTAAPVGSLNVGTTTSSLGSFFVGASATITAPNTGGPWHLFLGDNDGGFGDNSGAYSVTITVNGDPCLGDGDGDGYCPSTNCYGSLPGDCDDTDAAISPAAIEVCDSIDNNCDLLVDDDDPAVTAQPTWYDDLDGDGDGVAGTDVLACVQPPDTSTTDTDCDDADPFNAGTLAEVCDGQDNNCDTVVDEGFDDFDVDGLADCVDPDDDDDGVDDSVEDAVGSDPFDIDSDDDGIPDGDEIGDDPAGALDTDGDLTPDILDPDDDGDGIPTLEEGDGDVDQNGTPNYLDLDADGDGALDADEGTGDVDGDGTPNFLDPDDADGPDADADGDGLTNGEEGVLGTNAYEADTDGDGLDDGDEVNVHGTNPLDDDSDDDGLLDGEEIDEGTNPLDDDSDDDGLLDGDEVDVHGTDPLDDDTDGDGLLDGEEVDVHGTDPLSGDTDDDGLGDAAEIDTWETDPTNADTDGDGMDDGTEVDVGADPLDEDTDDDGILDGPDGLGDDDDDGILNVLDPTDDRDTGDDDDDDAQDPACGCTTSASSGSWGWLAALGLLGVRRRR